MKKETVLLADAWAGLANAATTRVIDVERHTAPPASDLLREALRRFHHQPAPRSHEELWLRHMHMSWLQAVIGAIAHADTMGQMVPDEAGHLMGEARALAEMSLPATHAEFGQMNVAIMGFYVMMHTRCGKGGLGSTRSNGCRVNS